VIALAAYGARSRRNLAALVLAAAGTTALTQVTLAGSTAGLGWAAANAVGFTLYVVLGHRVASSRSRETGGLVPDGIDRLAVAVCVGAVIATPFGIGPALPALTHPVWLAWGAGVGICSTVIPYVADQVAMARLPRATYALLLSLLPVTAAACGLLILGQVPSPRESAGIVLVGVGVALHRPADALPAPQEAHTQRLGAR
jgi:inner membrane transporter RhtA